MNLSEKYECLGGVVTYREIAHGAVPWLCDELVLTEPARARLRRWIEAGGLTQSRSRADLERRLHYLGDPGIYPIVVEALERIAPPACDLVLDRAWISGVGRSASGWTAVAPSVPEPGEEPLHLIALAGHVADDELAATTAHEVAHIWLLQAPATVHPPAMRREIREFTARLAEECGRINDITASWVASAVANERQACALARAWGFTGASADGASCAHSVRLRVLAEVAAVVAHTNGVTG